MNVPRGVGQLQLEGAERIGQSRGASADRSIFKSVRVLKTGLLWVVVLGAGATAGLWVALCIVVAFYRAFLPTSFEGIRRVSRFFFEDLAQRQTS